MTRIDLEKIFEFGDKETAEEFNKKKIEFDRLHKETDTSYLSYYTIELPFFKPFYLRVKKKSPIRTFCLSKLGCILGTFFQCFICYINFLEDQFENRTQIIKKIIFRK